MKATNNSHGQTLRKTLIDIIKNLHAFETREDVLECLKKTEQFKTPSNYFSTDKEGVASVHREKYDQLINFIEDEYMQPSFEMYQSWVKKIFDYQQQEKDEHQLQLIIDDLSTLTNLFNRLSDKNGFLPLEYNPSVLDEAALRMKFKTSDQSFAKRGVAFIRNLQEKATDFYLTSDLLETLVISSDIIDDLENIKQFLTDLNNGLNSLSIEAMPDPLSPEKIKLFKGLMAHKDTIKPELFVTLLNLKSTDNILPVRLLKEIQDLLTKNPVIDKFIYFTTSNSDNDIKNVAEGLASNLDTNSCDPKAALSFIQLANQNINQTRISDIAGIKKKFSKKESRMFCTTLMMVATSCFICVITLIGIAPIIDATYSLMSLGIIGVIYSQFIILRVFSKDKHGPDKRLPFFYMNATLISLAIILIITFQTAATIPLCVLAATSALGAQIYHQRNMYKYIATKPAEKAHTKNASEYIDTYNLTSLFAIDATTVTLNKSNENSAALA